MQDHRREEVGGALVPEVQVAGLAPERVDQNADHILDVGDFHRTLADLEQRIPAHRVGIGRGEVEDVAERLPMIGRDVPKLALAVVDEGALRPGHQSRHHMARALTAARRADDDGVLRAAVGQIAALEPAQHPAPDLTALAKQFGARDVRQVRPGVTAKRLGRAPRAAGRERREKDRRHRHREPRQPGAIEQPRVARLQRQIPFGEGPRPIEPDRAEVRPARPQGGRVVQTVRRLLGGPTEAEQDRQDRDRQDEEETLGGRHWNLIDLEGCRGRWSGPWRD